MNIVWFRSGRPISYHPGYIDISTSYIYIYINIRECVGNSMVHIFITLNDGLN